nr:hypothetical protein [Halomarina oriensis]
MFALLAYILWTSADLLNDATDAAGTAYDDASGAAGGFADFTGGVADGVADETQETYDGFQSAGDDLFNGTQDVARGTGDVVSDGLDWWFGGGADHLERAADDAGNVARGTVDWFDGLQEGPIW